MTFYLFFLLGEDSVLFGYRENEGKEEEIKCFEFSIFSQLCMNP